MSKFLLIIIFSFVSISLYSSENVKKSSKKEIYDLKENCELNFSSPIFDSYLSQISEAAQKIDGLPPEITSTFLTAADTPTEKRLMHKNIVTTVREALEKYQNQETIHRINALAASIFTEANVNDEHQKLLNEIVDLNAEATKSKPIYQQVKEIYAKLEERFKHSGYFSSDKTKKDYLLNGFLPSQIFSIENTHYLYMPNPIVEDKNARIKELSPLFLGYINHLKNSQMKHLYVNVKSISNELVQLAQSPDYENVFAMVSLDRSSEFYYQKNSWADKDDANGFKENLKRNLLENFSQSKIFEEHNWHVELDTILEDVHAKYFYSSSILTKMQRGAFIEISYAELAALACRIFQPNFVNVTCEFTIDRGPSQFAFIYLYDIYQKRGELTDEEQSRFLTLLFASPMIVHNRTAHDYRVNRMIETIEVLFNKQ